MGKKMKLITQYTYCLLNEKDFRTGTSEKMLYCEHCKKEIYDLRNKTQLQVTEVLEKEKEVCCLLNLDCGKKFVLY